MVNKSGQILVQKRADAKSNFPGMWDKSVGGGVMAGESIVEAALRETAEEIGLKVGVNDLIYIGSVKDEFPSGNDTVRMLLDNFVIMGDYDIKDMTFQKEEVSGIKFVTPEWIEQHSYITDPENSILGDDMWILLKDWLQDNDVEIKDESA
ncbi:MAG: NUDIX domain-containing protein [Rickettsiales bacterium]|nr:NUDIX domain-containing protein [Rickettsiales bacterium]